MRTCLAFVFVFCLIGLTAEGEAQETKKQYKGKLPTGWSKLLKLTPDQSAQIREIDRKSQMDTAPLFEKIREIRAKARQNTLAVLTKEQRKLLAESVLGKDLDEKKSEK
jgi:Spy/CpxP family protein refolding chaperone